MMPAEAQLQPHPTLEHYYPAESAKRGFLKGIFDDTAPDYDWIERLLSFGSGSWYRRGALVRAGLAPGMKVLDVAVGTGLVAREAMTLTGPAGRVIGLDPSAGWCSRPWRPSISAILGVAEQIPLADEQFEFVSMGYALRHVSDLHRAFSEFFRVLRPGGRLCLLEITAPRRPDSTRLLRAHMRCVVPLVTRIATGRAASPAALAILLGHHRSVPASGSRPGRFAQGRVRREPANGVARNLFRIHGPQKLIVTIGGTEVLCRWIVTAISAAACTLICSFASADPHHFAVVHAFRDSRIRSRKACRTIETYASYASPPWSREQLTGPPSGPTTISWPNWSFGLEFKGLEGFTAPAKRHVLWCRFDAANASDRAAELVDLQRCRRRSLSNRATAFLPPEPISTSPSKRDLASPRISGTEPIFSPAFATSICPTPARKARTAILRSTRSRDTWAFCSSCDRRANVTHW